MAVIYMDRISFNSMTESDILRIYNDNKVNITKYKHLDDQYIGKHKILETVQTNTASAGKTPHGEHSFPLL